MLCMVKDFLKYISEGDDISSLGKSQKLFLASKILHKVFDPQKSSSFGRLLASETERENRKTQPLEISIIHALFGVIYWLEIIA